MSIIFNIFTNRLFILYWALVLGGLDHAEQGVGDALSMAFFWHGEPLGKRFSYTRPELQTSRQEKGRFNERDGSCPHWPGLFCDQQMAVRLTVPLCAEGNAVLFTETDGIRESARFHVRKRFSRAGRSSGKVNWKCMDSKWVGMQRWLFRSRSACSPMNRCRIGARTGSKAG